MRTFGLFALALAASAALTTDASAIGRKNRGSSSCGCGTTTASAPSCGGCGTTTSYASSCGGCGTGAPAYMGTHGYHGRVGYAPSTVSGQAAVIQANDGQIYRLGADGSYYAGSGVTTVSGFYSPNQTVYPAGGTVPLTMPGATVPGMVTPRR